MKSLESSLIEDIGLRESLDPNHYYDAKRHSIRTLREMDCSDAEIEKMLGITLRPEDRSA